VSSSARAAAAHRFQSRAAVASSSSSSSPSADVAVARLSHAPPLPPCILHSSPFLSAATLQVTAPSQLLFARDGMRVAKMIALDVSMLRCFTACKLTAASAACA
jgi:hypothetical protein